MRLDISIHFARVIVQYTHFQSGVFDTKSCLNPNIFAEQCFNGHYFCLHYFCLHLNTGKDYLSNLTTGNPTFWETPGNPSLNRKHTDQYFRDFLITIQKKFVTFFWIVIVSQRDTFPSYWYVLKLSFFFLAAIILSPTSLKFSE